MEALGIIEGEVALLDRDDVDTDQIIPKQFLKRVERSGYGKYLFYDWQDEIDLPHAPILIAGENFACGSSREHAVWALTDWGFRAVIAPSFSDIFQANARRNGLLLVCLEKEHCLEIARAGRARIDLADQTVVSSAGVFEFDFDPKSKDMMLRGADEISETLERLDEIESYEKSRFGKQTRRVSKKIAIYLLALLAAIALFAALRVFVFEIYQTPSASMSPSIPPDSRVVVDKISAHLGWEPSRGDVVFFHLPRQGERNALPRCRASRANALCSKPWKIRGDGVSVKRVVALGGDRISMRDGQLLVNGTQEAIVPCRSPACRFPRKITVPQGHVFLLGDNRANSDDSRFWGPVPSDWIIGRARWVSD